MVIEIDQETLGMNEKIKSTVRMTLEERQKVDQVFGGVQRAFDKVVRDAEEESGWLPSLPKRMIPAFRAVRDIALTRGNQAVDSNGLREVIMTYCDCQRKTAVRHLHEMKRRGLIYTFGPCGDEHMHFIACSEEDVEKIKGLKA